MIKRIDNLTNLNTKSNLLIKPVRKIDKKVFIKSSDDPKTIQYSWKGGEWRDLRKYPSAWAEWEMNKLHMLYSYEYKFRIK